MNHLPAKRGSPGGQACARIQREQAIARYLAAPNICQQCGQPIALREGQKPTSARKKLYCDHRCAARATNGARPHKPPSDVPLPRHTKRPCARCGERCAGRLCRHCQLDEMRTLGAKSKGKVRRPVIAKHARSIMGERPRTCAVCGYSAHVEVCHRIPVASFAADVLLSVINAPENLVYLCPNHHWELDRGRLQL